MSIKLNTGAEMPLTGFGVWKVAKSSCADTVINALKAGYRTFDCAADYGNCVQVGEGFKQAFESGLVKREDVFITSKLWNSYHDPEVVEKALDRILSDMQLEYLDLFLMHFPISFKYVPFEETYPSGFGTKSEIELADVPIIDTWRVMEKIYKAGKKVKAIGVSNFNGGLLTDLIKQAEVVPAALQIEHHPYLQQSQLVRFAQHKGVAITAYSSFGGNSYLELDNPAAKSSPNLLEHATITAIADKHGKTSAQVLLRWATQRNIAVIPKSNNPNRLKENLEFNDFNLTDEDFDAIRELERNLRFNDPKDWAGPNLCIF
ncbi:NAD(P)H-dependent D-xylose reductase (XR) [Yamadazyma tenuis]|uniref:Aldo/keto reductase n=1 Tax=Candida tenuis (strain ATCC 10573 / BCRC 21748 / CBS 615 / JCM 9827 / NBRC 10315 / NRRL Y-1498 / VKM Y-70) TaxID=590646 RepID=G3BB51_CANTC|nr:Aldo/keto reductase [Yamadazyma tenuis ATCC 10573]EGV62141.1 Aldo/keto reductase [Yamadazyma tenuis ATCC 10573]WEJ93400.1 NAD(P)H-dependent D-xylose reductase (XR) [Yamadazyma tenuis]